jgi:ribosomal protein S18 acetylase RimI-like enzyme
MVGHALQNSIPFHGLRRFDVMRDLGQVADLMRIAFIEELGPSEIDMLREMRALQALAPLLWLTSRMSSELQDSFSGFVWIENGRVVGNVTVTRTRLDTRVWLISNVAVDPAYRRRGIARELMRAVIDWARECGIHGVYLQVRQANTAAQSLYRQLGFVLLDSITELRLARIVPIGTPLAARNFELKPWDGQSRKHAYELAKATVPEMWQKFQPIRISDFKLSGLPERIFKRLLGQQSYGSAVLANGRYAAFVRVHAGRSGGTHQIELMVRPDWRGRVENCLVSCALALLQTIANRPVLAEVPTEHVAAIEALHYHGFSTVRSLDRLGLTLAPSMSLSRS